MLLIGIDQSPERHEVCTIDPGGSQLARPSVPHSASESQQLHQCCQMLQAARDECLVALESDHSLVVDYLLDHGYPVSVVPGKAVDPGTPGEAAGSSTAVEQTVLAWPRPPGVRQTSTTHRVLRMDLFTGRCSPSLEPAPSSPHASSPRPGGDGLSNGNVPKTPPRRGL